MNTRGLMELVALNIGLDAGVILPPLFSMMVLMTLVTTIMAGPLVLAFL
jgi:Kef-type K+ transport system membrane component KefB